MAHETGDRGERRLCAAVQIDDDLAASGSMAAVAVAVASESERDRRQSFEKASTTYWFDRPELRLTGPFVVGFAIADFQTVCDRTVCSSGPDRNPSIVPGRTSTSIDNTCLVHVSSFGLSMVAGIDRGALGR